MDQDIYQNTFENTSTILVFKTDIKTKKNARAISSILNAHFSIVDCSVDTDDIDNVLRIVPINEVLENDVISLLSAYGFDGEVLPD